jgi:hypothetical protein
MVVDIDRSNDRWGGTAEIDPFAVRLAGDPAGIYIQDMDRRLESRRFLTSRPTFVDGWWQAVHDQRSLRRTRLPPEYPPAWKARGKHRPVPLHGSEWPTE